MPSTDNEPVVDRAVIAGLKELGGPSEPGLFLELVELFVQDALVHVRALEAALKSGDAQSLERAAHTLKSSSANVGGARLSKLCAAIESCTRSHRLTEAAELVPQVARQYSELVSALESEKR
jgi:HPt (histidine-containing phosphotransfer) domain-containing protein